MALLLANVLLILLSLREVHTAYNCNRPGSKCVHGSCDYNNVCSCFRGYTGYLCDTETAKLASSCPKNFKCKSEKCLKDARGTVNGCLCDYDFYGPACDKPRYTLDCFYDRMLIGLNPVGFQGHIRYIDKLTSSSCDLKTIVASKAAGVKDFDGVDWDGYAIKAIHKQDPCNGDAAYSTTHGFDIYTRKLVVQYYDRVYVSLDEIVTFICAVEKNNPVNVMKSVFTAPLEEGFLDKASVRGVGTHFVFSLHKSDDDGQIGDGDTLGVGALVFLKVKIREHSPFATLIIESCTADDGMGGNQTTYTFHDQGCPVAPVGQWIMKPNAKEFQLYFKIFRFEDTNQLRITCVVRGCTSWDSPSCSIHIDKPFALHHINWALHRRVIPDKCLKAQQTGKALKHVRLYSQCSHVDRRKRDAQNSSLTKHRKLKRRRRNGLRPLRTKRNSDGQNPGQSPNKNTGNIVLPDKDGKPQVNKLNSSEVIRLTVVITDKKKGKGKQEQGVLIREVAAPNFQACTLSFEFWTLMISMTVVVVALTASTVSCALKRRKLKNRRKRKNEKTVKMALNNMKRMQMSSLPWSFYNR